MSLANLVVQPVTLLHAPPFEASDALDEELERQQDESVRRPLLAARDFLENRAAAHLQYMRLLDQEIEAENGLSFDEAIDTIDALEADFEPFFDAVSSRRNAERLERLWKDVAKERTSVAWAKYTYFRALIDALATYKRDAVAPLDDQEAGCRTESGAVN